MTKRLRNPLAADLVKTMCLVDYAFVGAPLFPFVDNEFV